MSKRMLIVASAVSALMLAGPTVSAYTNLAQDQKPVEKPKESKDPQRQGPPDKPKPGEKPQPQRPARPEPQRPARPEPQRPQPEPARPQPQPARPQSQRPVPQPQPQRPAQQGAQPQGRGAQGQGRPQRLAEPEQQRRISEQQQRLTQYGDQLVQQQRLAPQRGQQLQQQHRTAQFAFQQQYFARMNDQQARLRNSGSYNYFNDPYFYTPSNYRYQRAGRFYETNELGATAMRQAVNFGYEEGFGAGLADRQDRWTFSYQDSYAYQDGNFGYGGFYIDRDDYNYYFREGFRRGYDDGFYGRAQYGRQVSGHYSVIGGLLNVILGLKAIR